jgi:hypothetical protein
MGGILQHIEQVPQVLPVRLTAASISGVMLVSPLDPAPLRPAAPLQPGDLGLQAANHLFELLDTLASTGAVARLPLALVRSVMWDGRRYVALRYGRHSPHLKQRFCTKRRRIIRRMGRVARGDTSGGKRVRRQPKKLSLHRPRSACPRNGWCGPVTGLAAGCKPVAF